MPNKPQPLHLGWSEPDFIPYKADLSFPTGPVLVLAPHPDDEVLGCTGAILQHVRSGDRLRVMIATDSDYGHFLDGQSPVLARQQESRDAAKLLGYGEPEFWNYPDRSLAFQPELVERIASAIDAMQANLVYTPSLWEIHPDHYALASSVLRAVAQLSRPVTIAMYEVGMPLHPNRLLDITDVLDIKQQAIACFKSQLAMQAYDRHILALNQFRTYTLPASVRAAEAYHLLDWSSLGEKQPRSEEDLCLKLAAQSPWFKERLAHKSV